MLLFLLLLLLFLFVCFCCCFCFCFFRSNVNILNVFITSGNHDDVEKIVQAANRFNVCIIPYGGQCVCVYMYVLWKEENHT